MNYVKDANPFIYIALLKSLRGHERSLAAITDLFDDKVENFTWYVYTILLPKL